MKRRIITIDREKCNGCGLCAEACHEGAIGMLDGKAALLREDYCDGLGDCLPACPVEAIAFEEREAPAYDHAAVLAAKARRAGAHTGGCPGSRSQAIARDRTVSADSPAVPSELAQWPVQIKLMPVCAPYYDGADLLIAADCAAYAYGDFHRRFVRGRTVLIGCPKLDDGDYAEKLAEIIRCNALRSITVVRMEVPCCSGLENAAKRALQASGKRLPMQVEILSIDGEIVSQ